MRAFRAPPEEIERVQQAMQARKAALAGDDAANVFGVWADNVAIVDAWVGIETQWRTAGMTGVMTGLDYSAVTNWLQLFVKQSERKEIMRGLQTMERAALAAMAELRAQE